MENYEIVKAIDDFKTRLSELSKAINIEKVKEELASNEQLLNNPDFWNNQKESAEVLKKIKDEKDKISSMDRLCELEEELELYFEMNKTEGGVDQEIEETVKTLEKELSEFEIRMLLSHEYDDCDAIFDMHPGAGGTESQDWCQMLFRMYQRYAEKHGFEVEVLDYQAGEEAGIKSVSFIVHGEKAYGYLKGEQGVHRLVRISPFDSNARRHTSFCAITITPSIEKDINIEVRPEDIRVDVYRSSGAGGQYINKTDTAVRITHLKTGIVVSCQTQRSQFQNRDFAMKMLKTKLYLLEKEEQAKKLKEITGEASDNSFGSQIRSYVFHPYSMVKDHRTDYEEYNTGAIMDGDIDGFINSYLKSPYNSK